MPRARRLIGTWGAGGVGQRLDLSSTPRRLMCASQALPRGAQNSPGASEGTARSTGRRAGQREAQSGLSQARGQAGSRWELSPWQSHLRRRRGGARQPSAPAGTSRVCHSSYLFWTFVGLGHSGHSKTPGAWVLSLRGSKSRGEDDPGAVGERVESGPWQGNLGAPARLEERAPLVAVVRWMGRHTCRTRE